MNAAAYGGKATQHYLLQRIAGASPEQLASLLLEGAQRFLVQAMEAMERRDIPAKARLVNRVSAILEELVVQLNPEGGELAGNLSRVYEWWLFELFEASRINQLDRLRHIHAQMGEIRATFEQLSQGQPAPPAQGSTPAGFGSEGLLG
jgi:flagellar protein FliS